MTPADILPDVLEPGLVTVFCGSAVGAASRKAGAYYAGPGNRFWKILNEAGFTDRRLRPPDYPSLPGYGIGLTDLAKSEFGNDADLSPDAYRTDVLLEKIQRYQPRILAFTAKTPARSFLRERFGATLATGEAGLGLHAQTVGKTRIWVLPSTSGKATSHWRTEPWHALFRLHQTYLSSPGATRPAATLFAS